MFGIILAAASNLFEELSESIAKNQVSQRSASFYTLGFLSALAGTIFFLVEGLARDHFIFAGASLPTFLPRLVLEVLQAHVSIRAITLVARGDYGLLRTFTIPLLLIADVALGYSVASVQVLGMALIVCAVVVLILIERSALRGFSYLAIGTVNAAVTITLFKYDISHFNSVEAEQALIGIVLMIYFFTLAYVRAGENPWHFLTHKIFLGQSLASGLSSVAISFAYLYAPASIVMTAQRSFAVLFAILAGRFYFREKHFMAKIILFIAVAAGLVLLVPAT